MLKINKSEPLEIFEVDDENSIEGFYEILTNESIYQFIPAPPPRDLMDFMRRHASTQSRLIFGAYLDVDKNFPVGLLEIDVSNPGEASIGYLISNLYWWRGFASRLIASAIRKSSSRVRAFCAVVDSQNVGSIRVLEKNGFVRSEIKPSMLKMQASTDFVYRRDV